MNKFVLMIAVSFFALLVGVSSISAQSMQKSEEQKEWIGNSLQEMEKIKVGMTRGDLLRVFETEGGISTRVFRAYVYRKCPYIKVDVAFSPVGKTSRNDESDKDIIKSISKPYLERTIVD